MPLGKTPSQVIFIPKKRGITHPLGRIFSKICPPARKRGGDRNYGAVSEKYKIDLTNSINSPYFSNWTLSLFPESPNLTVNLN